jgi:glycerophosphoryl diester phosphodiesterase
MRENTVAAFREAYARGADAVEMDLRRTADGALVVHHDAEVPGLGPIIGLDRHRLREAAPWIPDLDAALTASAGMWINVEIKNDPADPDWDPSHRVASLAAALLNEVGVADRVLVSSFNLETIRAFTAAGAGIRTGMLVTAGDDAVAALADAVGAGCVSLHAPAGALAGAEANRVAQACSSSGLLLLAWTVDDPDEMVRLADAGVGGIITNVPGAARSALEDHYRNRG